MADDTGDRIEHPRCSCGKVIFASRGQARTGMRNTQKRHPKEKLHVYYCEDGRAFHVGHASR